MTSELTNESQSWGRVSIAGGVGVSEACGLWLPPQRKVLSLPLWEGGGEMAPGASERLVPVFELRVWGPEFWA